MTQEAFDTHRVIPMTQTNLFQQQIESRFDVNWVNAGWALRQFYAATDNAHRLQFYSQFVKYCDVVAHQDGISFVEAAQRIHNMFNINVGNR